MTQIYINRKNPSMLICAREMGAKMKFFLLGKSVTLNKDWFLAQWRPAICEERPTA